MKGTTEREIVVKGWTGLNSLDWAAEARSLFVSRSITDERDAVACGPGGERGSHLEPARSLAYVGSCFSQRQICGDRRDEQYSRCVDDGELLIKETGAITHIKRPASGIRPGSFLSFLRCLLFAVTLG